MSRDSVGIKYYILEGGQAVRAASRRAWEHWFGTTPPNARLLVHTVVGRTDVKTYFYGVVHDGTGAYVTVVVGASGEETFLTEHGLNASDALQGHLHVTDGMMQVLEELYD